VHYSESQGKYLQELEKECSRRSTEREQRLRKIRTKDYDINLYEHAVKKEDDLRAREEAIKKREKVLLLKEEEVQKREQDLKLKQEIIEKQEEELLKWVM
jgi:lipopolysaccharide export system protein LptC